ncbi:MAG TPA: hypothetical protein VGD56_06660, partial [Gemmatirosa sp.]
LVALGVLLVAAGAGAAVVARIAPAAAARTPHLTLADGVRRLRAAVVGDVRELAVVPAPDENPVRARLRARTRRVAHQAAVQAAARNDAVGVPWWDENASWGADVVRWAERSGEPFAAEAGDTVTIAPPVLPALLPAALRARGVHWQATGPVTLIGDGRAVLDAPGSAVITAVTPIGVTHTPVTVRPAVRGRLYPAAAGGSVAARIIVRRGTSVDTAWTDASGRFRLALPVASDVQSDAPADVRVEPATAARGPDAWEPLLLHDVPAARLHTLGIVTLPIRWTITAGSFAGAAVPVRAAAARGYWQFTREHGAPVGWLHDAPHTVAFDPGFDPADQVTFWDAAHSVEDAWGHALFVPYQPPASTDSVGADIVVRAAPALHAEGLTTLSWDGGGTVGGAAIDLRVSRPGTLQPQVVAHELLHALGFGHARGWPTLLAPAGHALAPGPTVADVAYGQLYEAICRQARRATRDYGAAYGWAEAGA